ncbi:HD domain-containing protein [Vallitalea okinawensis]|uniref:HD domain-containing protein n=1 Tax=Vallitalea okinawensis TaxID=2078660 RepID=UPI000CFC03B6|nr:HD domain-containing protein [Vallitalea okinawensis]
MKRVPEMDVSRLNTVLTILFDKIKNKNDDNQVLPVMWQMMHMFSCSQLSKLVAMKRGLDPELAGIIAALHDIGVIELNVRKEHGKKGGSLIIKWCETYNEQLAEEEGIITTSEIATIKEAVEHHSDKDIYTDEDYIELMKDVDALDRYLHGVETKDEYVSRCEKVLEELGIQTQNSVQETKNLLFSIH